MTPAARVQAAVELLDETIAAARQGGAAADTLIGRYFKARRYAGSKDRRAIRELVFRAIRRSGDRPVSGRAALLGLAREAPELLEAFDGSRLGPAAIEEGEPASDRAVAPAWLIERFDPAIPPEELPALLERAPLDLRVNLLRGSPEDALAQLPEASLIAGVPTALRLPEGAHVDQTEAWHRGLVEVQDLGSQLVSLACRAAPAMRVVDLCAGAGGKTLALAAEMANQGSILACDTDRSRLSRMPARLARAGVRIVDERLLDPGHEIAALADIAGQVDLVLVDAPCSGTGTWRRNPETRWRATPQRLERLTALQARLLHVGASLVRPGGTLVYAVCSLLAEEGRDQAAALTGRSSLVPETIDIAGALPSGPGLLLSPTHGGTDGFFVARWRRPC